jgi:hypothetical protein
MATEIKGLKPNPEFKVIPYYRKPTKDEIKFGNGAIHHQLFNIIDCVDDKGFLMKFIISKDDGLPYFQSLSKY